MSSEFDEYFPIHNTVEGSGVIREQPQDFQVVEINHIDFSGEGEHLWLYIQKTGCNTDWVAKQLAQICQVPTLQVGYAGLKDRHAVTSQWFSVQLPKVSDPEQIQAQLSEEILIIKSVRHNKKLKTGGLKANQFKLLIRHIQGDKQQVENNIAAVIKHGVPNYFGEQRFGHHLNNVSKAADWFAGQFRPKNRNLKSLLISTARSWIFNHIISERIKTDCWLTPVQGDIFQLDGSHSWFLDDQEDQQVILQRLKEQDIHITAPLWGEDDLQSHADTALMEQRVADRFPEMLAGMPKHRLKHDRRATRMKINEMTYAWVGGDLELQFTLGPGGYATVVMREILKITG